VSTWSVVFLGIIAVATLATSIVQVGLLVATSLLARRVTRFVDEMERDIKPIVAHLDSMSRDGSRAAAMAVAQVERVDALFADVATKIDRTVSIIHSAMAGPAREGRAWIMALQAAIAAIREFRSGRSRSRGREEEDGLFI
jgi:hypothetical protein